MSRVKKPESSAAGGDVPDSRGPVSTRLVIGPNASLSPRQALLFFSGMCLICLGIAAAFAVQGYWPVLPFAGLELLALGVALVVVLRRNRYREVLRFEGGRVRLECGRVGQGASVSSEWPRSSLRVWLESGPNPSSPTQLVLACGPQRTTIGGCLTDAERAALARRLKELIHPAWVEAGLPEGARGLHRA
ncbi:MAG: DUF2244 domain-containing protein [Nevskiaceae bacterium]